MTGPQHYAEAERLLKSAHQPGKHGACTHAEAIAQAQVHATLALTAATIDAGNTEIMPPTRDGVSAIEVVSTRSWEQVTA